MFEPFLTAWAYEVRCEKDTPGQLVYGQDIRLPIKFRADWGLIEQQRQMIINKSNARENEKKDKT